MFHLIALVCAAAAGHAQAHQPDSGSWADITSQWSGDAWVIVPMVASALLYAAGVRRLWSRAGAGRGITFADALRFGAGWLVMGAALVSPIDAIGTALFSAHMVQHELLMVVAAPLLVRGRPLEAWTWALSREYRRRTAAALQRPALLAAWRWLSSPVGAWLVHAAAIWIWHVPPFFAAALHNDAIHALQHGSFLGTALLFWWAVLGPAKRRADMGAMASLLTTMLHTGALGALLTLAPTPWYLAEVPVESGLTALEDQQLGGLIMWLPGGTAYLVAALLVAATWLSPAGRTVRDGPRARGARPWPTVR